jgi:demethylmenaquinone methyltransferase/2-methoxy-6-polyprenyl-1,4-benzoquinol methylase
MGYALRHISDLTTAFREFHRVLCSGGRLCVLEITLPEHALPRALLKAWLKGVVPRIAALIASADSSMLMRYYWDTIAACVPPETILRELRAAGFVAVERAVELDTFSAYRARKAS